MNGGGSVFRVLAGACAAWGLVVACDSAPADGGGTMDSAVIDGGAGGAGNQALPFGGEGGGGAGGEGGAGAAGGMGGVGGMGGAGGAGGLGGGMEEDMGVVVVDAAVDAGPPPDAELPPPDADGDGFGGEAVVQRCAPSVPVP